MGFQLGGVWLGPKKHTLSPFLFGMWPQDNDTGQTISVNIYFFNMGVQQSTYKYYIENNQETVVQVNTQFFSIGWFLWPSFWLPIVTLTALTFVIYVAARGKSPQWYYVGIMQLSVHQCSALLKLHRFINLSLWETWYLKAVYYRVVNIASSTVTSHWPAVYPRWPDLSMH